MLKHCSSFFKWSPVYTQEIAESLYLQGFMTYPRTETTAYPEDFDFEEILGAFKRIKGDDFERFKTKSEELSNGNFEPPAGIDLGDHSPITPT